MSEIYMLFILSLLFNVAAAYTIRAYFPEWGIYGHNFKPSNVRASKITHLVYSFGVPNPSQADYDVLKANYAFPINVYDPATPEGNLVAYDTYAWSLNLPALKSLKAANPALKLILAIGGWSASWHLSRVFANDVTRARFVATSADFLLKSGFDGIDLDWEYPGAKGASYNFFSADDSANLGKLCAELRQAIGTTKELSLAISGDPAKQKYYTSCIPYADSFGIMTYDFHGGWDGVGGHQSAYFHNPAQGPDDEFNAAGALASAITLGYPKNKISIGSPFYGRGWTGCSPRNASFPIFGTCAGQVQNYDKTGGEPGLLDYRFLLPLLSSSDYTKYYDPVAQAAFAYSPSKRELWTYENVDSVKFKAQKVKENQLDGMIIWEISEDTLDSTSLLNTIYSELNSVTPSPTPSPIAPVTPQPTPSPIAPVTPSPTPSVTPSPTPQPTPSPIAPVTPSPTPPTTQCAASRERCGGSTYTGPKCCVPGNSCKFVDSCYSQCVADVACAPLWSKCGGIGWTGPTCCASGRCSYVSDWYSQCVA